jgi:basic membrane protein A and related proteins
MSRTRTRLLALSTLALALVPALVACGTSGGGATSTAKKICLVTDIGGLNDRGFNALANQGLEQAKTELGVTGTVTESKSGNDYVPNLTNCVTTQNADLTIGVGFLMQDAIGTVAGQFPNKKFAIVDGTGTKTEGTTQTDLNQANVTGLFFKEQDAGALVGVIAGELEKTPAAPLTGTKVISAVGGISIPPVNRYIAGYQFGAAQVDPTIKVLIGYSNDFQDAAKCKSVAESQIANKSEIVFQVAGGCGLGALKAAGEKHVYSIGVDSDQKAQDNSVIASALKRVNVATFTAIKNVVDGKDSGHSLLFGLDNDGVGYAPGNITLSQAILDKVKSVSDAIKAGTLKVPDTIAS